MGRLKGVLCFSFALLMISMTASAGSDNSIDAVRKAAEKGDVEAQHALGLAYFSGQGAPKNLAEAVKWFRQAAEKGLAGAQYMLGVTCLVGEDGPKDYGEAVKWFSRAAEQGFTEAQYMLSAAYATGKGIKRDYVAAYMWSNIAARRGDKDASELRDEVAQGMSPDQLALAQQLARDWKPKLQVK